jgi:hypothetical protein
MRSRHQYKTILKTAAEDIHSSSEDDSYQPTKVVIDEFINKSAVF